MMGALLMKPSSEQVPEVIGIPMRISYCPCSKGAAAALRSAQKV